MRIVSKVRSLVVAVPPMSDFRDVTRVAASSRRFPPALVWDAHCCVATRVLDKLTAARVLYKLTANRVRIERNFTGGGF